MMRRIKKGIAVLAAALCLGGSLGGCRGLGNTEFVLTTGVKGDQLFKVGNSVCTLPEAMIYALDYQIQYENVYGVEMWEHDFGGITLEEYVKETIISQLASMKAVTLLAEEYEVELSKEEKEKAAKAAEEYFGSLSQAEIDYMGLEQKDAENLYLDHVLSRKVYGEITRDVNTEVSDDEARIITVQQIFLDSRESAENVKERLEEGKEFVTLASAYSRDDQITYTFGRGEKPSAYEEAAFALENEQVSEIVETEDGFYLLKCVNNFDREATEVNKVTMVEKRRDEIFGKVYAELIANTPSEFNNKLWESVHFADWTEEGSKSFLEIYNSYFGENA